MDSISFTISQHKLKDILSFFSNTTEEVTWRVSTFPTETVALYANLSSNKIYVSLDRNQISNFRVSTSSSNGLVICYNTYISSILNPISTFKKDDDLVITVTNKSLGITNITGRIISKIGCINSIQNHYFTIPDHDKYCIKSSLIEDILQFFKVINLFINQEKTEFYIRVDNDSIILFTNALETEYAYVLDLYLNKPSEYTSAFVKPSVLARFRNIKNLASSFTLSIYAISETEYDLVIKPPKDKEDIDFYISIPLKNKPIITK